MRRPLGRLVVAIIFALLTLNAWGQVLLAVIGRSNDPSLLVGLQFAVGAAGGLAAAGSWLHAAWAPAAALSYGAIAAAMIVSLESILDLGPESRTGLWTGAAVLLLFGLGSAWYLRRTTPQNLNSSIARSED